MNNKTIQFLQDIDFSMNSYFKQAKDPSNKKISEQLTGRAMGLLEFRSMFLKRDLFDE